MDRDLWVVFEVSARRQFSAGWACPLGPSWG
jgi:hypothetical protein